MKAYKFKLKANKKFEEEATRTLNLCRELYNACLEERRNAHQFNLRASAKPSIKKASVGYFSQKRDLPFIKESRPEFKNVHSQVLQDVVARVERSFDGFFRRVAEGSQSPGYPRFKGVSRYNSFTYTQSGFDLKGDKLTLSKIGSVRVHLSREIQGKVKICAITKEIDGWYVVFTVDTASASKSLPKTGETVGIDVGIEAFATLSTGERIENKRFVKNAERELKTAQRRVARRPKKTGSNRRKAVKFLARKYRKTQRQRRDFHFKQAKKLVARFDVIKFEDLTVKNLVKNHHLAKAIHDVAWRQFITITAYKAEEAGKQVLVVNPNGTSQICSRCKGRVEKDLSVRWHECPGCGLSIHRDHNSALEIKDRSGRPFVEPEGSKRRRNSKLTLRKKREPLTDGNGASIDCRSLSESPTKAGFAA
jgi:putative transposase